MRPGKVQVVYRRFQTATRDQQTVPAPAGRGAGRRPAAAFWNYAELFYHEQGQEDSGYVNESYLDALAQQVPGLNMNTWKNDRNSPSLAPRSTATPPGRRRRRQRNADARLQGPEGPGAAVSGDIPYDSLQQTIKSVS